MSLKNINKESKKELDPALIAADEDQVQQEDSNYENAFDDPVVQDVPQSKKSKKSKADSSQSPPQKKAKAASSNANSNEKPPNDAYYALEKS